MNFNNYSKYAPFVLRLGIGFVFAWFGYSGLTNPDMWIGLVPAWTAAIAPAKTLVLIHGAVELIGGLLLIAGLWVRPVAAVLFLSLAHTLTILKFGPVFVRDIGLLLATLAIFLRDDNK
jgi:uncharacterized membrane protein YphA (DoxX/SURF4 family)